jgi:hypothetical protein
MTNQNQNQQAIREGQQGGPAQKNQAVQDGMGAERDLSTQGVVENDEQRAPPPQTAGANQFPEKIRRDPNRDLTHVPGTFNPGNQAGKPVEGGGQVPAGQPGGPSGNVKDDQSSDNANPDKDDSSQTQKR